MRKYLLTLALLAATALPAVANTMLTNPPLSFSQAGVSLHAS
jgi:hypothetical protein